MNWKFWTWGDLPKAKPQELPSMPSALRVSNTPSDHEPKPSVVTSVIPVQQAAPISPIVYDDENEEEDDCVAFPEFKPLRSFKTENIPEAYINLALSIGCATPDIVRAKLEKYFVEENIPIAECEDVREWLDDRLNYINADSWHWRPLRQKDEMIEISWSDEYSSKSWGCRIYNMPIPERVLKRLEKMMTAFGDTIRFFVSDFEDHDYTDHESANIFIMVLPTNHIPDTVEDENFYFVFDTWAKPCYDDTPSTKS